MPTTPGSHDPDKDPLAAWRRAEALGDEASAETALRSLFACLPSPEVPPEFALRVVAAAGLARSGMAGDPRWRAVGRILAALALFAAGASILLFGPLVGLVPRLVSAPSAERLATGLGWIVGPAEIVATFGRVAGVLADALGRAAATQEVWGALLLGLLVAVSVVRSLVRLLESREGLSHVA